MYVYPLLENTKSILINEPPKPVKKQKVKAIKTCQPNDPFIQLWQNIIGIVTKVAKDFDAQWQKRRRTLNTLLVVLFIFRLVFQRTTEAMA